MRALRAQADKHAYATEMKHTIEKENLTLRQIVEELIVEDGVCRGVVTSTGAAYRSQAVVITAGTALRGEIIIGELKYSSGPNNSQPSVGLANHLKELGLEIDRFKTGTPPRVKSSTIDYSVTEEQPGDKEPNHFSYSTPDSAYNQNQEPCWLTYTNETTHEIIQKSTPRPMFTGIVEGGRSVLSIHRGQNCSFCRQTKTPIVLGTRRVEYRRSLRPRLIYFFTRRCPNRNASFY